MANGEMMVSDKFRNKEMDIMHGEDMFLFIYELVISGDSHKRLEEKRHSKRHHSSR